MKEAGQLVAMLFLARDLAHREHFRTSNYAAHVALGAFYEAIIPMADAFAESYMGRYDETLDIPLMDNSFDGDIIDVLEQQHAWIEDTREQVCPRSESALQNEIDTIVNLYQRTLFLLRRYRD